MTGSLSNLPFIKSGSLIAKMLPKLKIKNKSTILVECICGTTKTILLEDFLSKKITNCGIRHKLINLNWNETIFSRVRMSK